MIQGDLNAKTGILEDTISPDKSDELFKLSFNQPPPMRNSQDSAVNFRGNELVFVFNGMEVAL